MSELRLLVDSVKSEEDLHHVIPCLKYCDVRLMALPTEVFQRYLRACKRTGSTKYLKQVREGKEREILDTMFH
jgi:hypothetical protein